MTGAGFSPAGVSPAGSGTPATTTGPSGTALTDDYGRQHGARYIDPATRRYVLDANGRYKGMPAVSQMVELAFLTLRGSSALPNLGMEKPSGVIGSNFVAKREQAVREAFQFLTRAQLAELVSVTVDTSRRPVVSIVRWRDLTTAEEQETRI